MLLSLFIVSVFILVVCEVAEEKKQKEIRRHNKFVVKYLQRIKHGRVGN